MSECRRSWRFRDDGARAVSMTRADGRRQMSVAVNLQRWNRLDASGRPEPQRQS
ncbi:hypothetical protein GTW67_28785 [Streptomyces sp. SID5910]|nr:hypothetical protein [Streptomyces sp. SID5910]